MATTVGFVFLGATWMFVWRRDDARVERAGDHIAISIGAASSAGNTGTIVLVPFLWVVFWAGIGALVGWVIGGSRGRATGAGDLE